MLATNAGWNTVIIVKNNSVIAELQDVLAKQPKCLQVAVAFSGGIDSHVLLHAIKQLSTTFPECDFRAIHINHGLSPSSSAWEAHCIEICQELAISLTVQHANINRKGGESLEALARTTRYALLADVLIPSEYLLTAHTADDQAETFLLQALRGAGPKGLSAMPLVKSFSDGYLLRPLLAVSREEIECYASFYKLLWVEDESNLETHFDRNFLRHNVIPSLKKRWPHLLKTLPRAAEHCANSSFLTDEIAASDMSNLSDERNNTLLINGLIDLSTKRQSNVIRYWLHQNGCSLPSTQQLQQINRDILQARPDAMPTFQWGNHLLRRYQNALYITPLLVDFPTQQFSAIWNLEKPLQLPDNSRLLAIKCQGKGINLGVSNCVQVNFRSGGEKLNLQEKSGSKTLKNLFQQWSIPPWKRSVIPLIWANEVLVSVVDYCIAHDYKASEGQEGWVIVREPSC